MAQRHANYPVVIDTQGESTNPTTSTILADTGQLGDVQGGGGIYEVLATFSASADAEFTIQRRNAGNTATVGDAPIIYVPAKNTVAIPFRFEIEKNERVRITMDSNLTGVGVASVTAQKVG